MVDTYVVENLSDLDIPTSATLPIQACENLRNVSKCVVFRMLPVGIMMSSGFFLCAVIFLSQCHCHSVRHVHLALFW